VGLLVEDDRIRATRCANCSSRSVCQCTAVPSAKEAISLVAAQRYDILLSDITLPGISGSELARTLRRVQPEIRVVLVSGYGDTAESAMRFRARGCCRSRSDIATFAPRTDRTRRINANRRASRMRAGDRITRRPHLTYPPPARQTTAARPRADSGRRSDCTTPASSFSVRITRPAACTTSQAGIQIRVVVAAAELRLQRAAPSAR